MPPPTTTVAYTHSIDLLGVMKHMRKEHNKCLCFFHLHLRLRFIACRFAIILILKSPIKLLLELYWQNYIIEWTTYVL